MIENEEEKLLKRLNKVIDECIVIYNKYEITDEELAALSASHIANMLLRSGCENRSSFADNHCIRDFRPNRAKEIQKRRSVYR